VTSRLFQRPTALQWVFCCLGVPWLPSKNQASKKCDGVSGGVSGVLALTDKEVRALPQRSQRYRDSDGAGLLLDVDPVGGKYWLWRHRCPPTKDGRRQNLRIGPYPRISLKAARDIRDEQKRLFHDDGINPCDAEKRSKDHRWGRHAQLTFEAVALDWHATKTAGTWTERHSDDVLKKLNKDILLSIGGMAIDAITAQDCLAVLRSIEQRGSNETAKRSLGVISEVLDYAVASGFVFQSQRTATGFISNNTVNMALKRMGFDRRMCGHCFRAMAMTNIQEQLGIDLRIVDHQLAHIEKNKVTAAYNRAEYWPQRVEMMQRCADLLDQVR
jgi:hypothetical protein